MSQSDIQVLRDSVTAFKAKELKIAAFCAAWRQQQALLASLPPRYRDVMEDLLGRLESGSHFTEESCSYSQDDLLAALLDWLDKASLKLAAS